MNKQELILKLWEIIHKEDETDEDIIDNICELLNNETEL